MFASVLIIAVSLVLLVYWFRYTCLLLLRNGQADAIATAEGSGLTHLQVQERLAAGDSFDPLHEALNRDYAVLTYLLQHAAGINLNPVERHILINDYRVMRLWYRLTRGTAPAQARRALDEMGSIVRFLAYRMGERTTADASSPGV